MHDLMVHEFKPCVGLCAYRMEPAWDSLSTSFSVPPLLVRLSLSPSLKKINIKKNFFEDPPPCGSPKSVSKALLPPLTQPPLCSHMGHRCHTNAILVGSGDQRAHPQGRWLARDKARDTSSGQSVLPFPTELHLLFRQSPDPSPPPDGDPCLGLTRSLRMFASTAK